MFWIALAAQLSAPQAIGTNLPDVRGIFSVDDFPAYVQASGVSRIVHTRTTVGPDGAIQNCVAEISSGDRRLDTYTCELIVKRAKFQPASWIDGTPAHGVLRVPVSWRVSNYHPTAREMLKNAEPDVDLAVNELPKGAGSIAIVGVQVAADSNGRVLACVENPAVANGYKKHFPELAAIACQRVMADYTAVPPVDGSGKALRSVQTVLVRFTKDR